MKKILSIIIAALLLMSLFTVIPFFSGAALERSGDYEYEILSDGTASIEYYHGADTDLVVPSELDGYKVSTIAGDRYWYAPGKANLKSIKLPDTIQIIEYWVFEDCSSLTEITIPDSVKEIDVAAFRRCTSLADIHFSGSVKKIGDYAFDKCTSLVSFTVPDSVIEIGEYAFRGCTSLESFVFGKRVKSIGNGLFQNCDKLDEITFNDSLVSVGSNVFADLDSKTKWETPWHERQPYGVVYAGKVAIEYNGSCSGNFTLKNDTRGIAASAFYDCNAITEIIIPDSVIEIGQSAFESCDNLEKVTLGKKLTTIGGGAFRYTKVADINFPDSLLKIGSTALDCPWLDNQPDGVVYAGHVAYSMKGSDYPSVFTLKEGTRGISPEAFSSCKLFSEITIPDSVIYVGDHAFSNIPLKKVTISWSVKEIGDEAFGYQYIFDLHHNDYYKIEGFMIYGYSGSTAEEYAIHNGIDFVSIGNQPVIPEILLGDADGNGEVDMADATVIQRVATLIAVPYDVEQLMSADVDGDEILTIVDATFIQRYSTRIAVPHPIGEPIE